MRIMIPNRKTNRIDMFDKIHFRVYIPHSSSSLFVGTVDFLSPICLNQTSDDTRLVLSKKAEFVWMNLWAATKTLLMYFNEKKLSNL